MTATADVPFAFVATPPEPTGYHDVQIFRDTVMRFTGKIVPPEPFETSKRRLWEFVQLDALMLRVEAALTPPRVAYAYRNHYALRYLEGDARAEEPHGRRDIAAAVRDYVETRDLVASTRRYLTKVERRATRRINRLKKETNTK